MLTEREFTSQIRELANVLGWRRYHTWLATHSPAGFPDEVLIRPPRIVFAELKSETGKLTPAQQEWLDAIANCGAETYLWRPPMIDQIAQLLQQPSRPETGPGIWLPPHKLASLFG